MNNEEIERIRNDVFASVISTNYDYVVYINGQTGAYTLFCSKDAIKGIQPGYGEEFDVIAPLLVSGSIISDENEKAVNYTRIASIGENLENRDVFQFICRATGEDEKLHYRKITQYYLNRDDKSIIMTREDVTDTFQAETQRNLALASALKAAEQASNAKSQFLSRVSHELRTPMNAIIGLSALAASDVNNPTAMEDAIGKIGMSARYLLSLINDILEMSRIESGRMVLNEGPFDFEQLISSVNTIIYGQATSKGIDYDAIANGFTEATYVGDVTKLQQILVNVLGNSIKFTSPGGKITLSIEQIRRNNDRATLRFIVSDTGIGIDEEFLPHIFDAFSQESSSYVSTTNGTGLGLAITKSMVEMMDGHISVKSIKNVGSVFTIEVQLGISEDSRQRLELINSMNLSMLKALVVDDDVVVCQSTQKILTSMGMQAEWVDSGIRAVNLVSELHKKNNDFDTIFIDWKMPDMDGIETTRQIRRIVGPDVSIIIMTAYDWSHIETEARAAGVDMFMEKPLFQSSIINAFENIFMIHKEKIKVEPRKNYRFEGRRFLLAEDHPLNAEVARRLLEKTGAEVIVVGNGLEAMETYTVAEAHYYDAILMDIRMPVMDGFAATANIRKLKKEGSREIPIIAMTANAFDEDVEQSQAHGMDAHITKPIEPELLYMTIERLLNKKNR